VSLVQRASLPPGDGGAPRAARARHTLCVRHRLACSRRPPDPTLPTLFSLLHPPAHTHRAEQRAGEQSLHAGRWACGHLPPPRPGQSVPPAFYLSLVIHECFVEGVKIVTTKPRAVSARGASLRILAGAPPFTAPPLMPFVALSQLRRAGKNGRNSQHGASSGAARCLGA